MNCFISEDLENTKQKMLKGVISMKKSIRKNIILGLTVCTVISGASSAALAAEDTPMLISSQTTAEETLVGTPVITVNSEKVDLSQSKLSQYLYDINGNTMVPLRAVAEKMGYKVDWNGEKQAITIGDNEWEAVINIGEDSYFGVTKIKDAVGMTAPQSYGTAPQLIEDTTFVPAKMFEIMGYTYSAVGQYVNFTNKAAEDSTQIPNPFTEYKTIDEAKKAVSFKAVTPASLPEGYKFDSVSVMGSDFLQVFYKNGDKEILYRVATGSEDISGDYNTYKKTESLKAGKYTVTVRRSEESSSVIWTDGDFTYAIDANGSLSDKEITQIIASIG